MARNPRRDAAYIEDILRLSGLIRSFIHGKPRNQFDRDKLLQSAVILNLALIGEAVSNLSNEFKAKHPTMPWRAITGLRNTVIHAYWNWNLDIIWVAAKTEVRSLAAYLRKVQKTLKP